MNWFFLSTNPKQYLTTLSHIIFYNAYTHGHDEEGNLKTILWNSGMSKIALDINILNAVRIHVTLTQMLAETNSFTENKSNNKLYHIAKKC